MEDKDFGILAHAAGMKTVGVILIRFPVSARKQLGQALVAAVAEIGERLVVDL